MGIRFEIDVHTGRLYNGRRSFYAMIKLGSRFAFVSRWDTARVSKTPQQFGTYTPKHWDLHRGPVMTWYAGTR